MTNIDTVKVQDRRTGTVHYAHPTQNALFIACSGRNLVHRAFETESGVTCGTCQKMESKRASGPHAYGA